jgi:type I restriction enzyme S subunit
MNDMTTIGAIADIFDGPHATPNKTEDGPYFMNIASLQNGRLVLADSAHLSDEDFVRWTKRVTPKENDLLFSYETRLGEAALMPLGIKACLGRRMGLLRPKLDKVDPQFLLYSYLGPHFQSEVVANTIKGATVERISVSEIGNFKIRVPDKVEQKRIAAVLSALDAKIDLNNRINAELDALAKTIYDYWFVQFDFPDTNSRPYKSSGGAMAWNDTLKREIPAGWNVAKLSSWIAKQKTGEWGYSERSDNNELQVTCIRGADINALNGAGELKAPTRYISSSKSGKFLASHDIVIEISGGSPTQSTGRAALISPEVIERFDTPLVCSNFCKALSLEDPERAHEFLQLWNALYSAGIFFGWEGKTSGIKNLQFDAFVENHSVPVAPAELSHKFQNISRSMEKRKQNGLRENLELTQLRDWLLPLLMNGQVRVG